MSMLDEIKKELRRVASKEKAKALAGFFKTGKGQYGEGDVFLGVMVPRSRTIAEKYAKISFVEIKKLLDSEVHEERFIALLILVGQYQKGDKITREKVFKFYVDNLKRVNNWDLVDLSAPRILGAQLFGVPKKLRTSLLIKFASSENLWERRVAIIATLYFINHGEFTTTLTIVKRLINDSHDLIHKSAGWMLREVGKYDLAALENFLHEKSRYRTMPRTMLRYAIELFPEPKRKKYLLGVV